MNIVIAPHADDEIIGCYSLIKKGLIDEVVYLDVTPERYRLARSAGRELGFRVRVVEYKDFQNFLYVNLNGWQATLLVPDIADRHLLHKAVNCAVRLSGCKLGYYTVDMNTGYTKELSKVDQQEKRVALNKYYPDQKSLWENDWRYFLFEGVVFEENNG